MCECVPFSYILDISGLKHGTYHDEDHEHDSPWRCDTLSQGLSVMMDVIHPDEAGILVKRAKTQCPSPNALYAMTPRATPMTTVIPGR